MHGYNLLHNWQSAGNISIATTSFNFVCQADQLIDRYHQISCYKYRASGSSRLPPAKTTHRVHVPKKRTHIHHAIQLAQTVACQALRKPPSMLQNAYTFKIVEAPPLPQHGAPYWTISGRLACSRRALTVMDTSLWAARAPPLSANTDSSSWHITLPAGAVQPMPGMSRAPMAPWPEHCSQLCPGFCAPRRRSPATAWSEQAHEVASLEHTRKAAWLQKHPLLTGMPAVPALLCWGLGSRKH